MPAGSSPGATVATTLNTNATPVPSAISVNMFRLRLTTDAHPRWKNGQPPQRATGVASTSSIHARLRGEIACCTGCPGSKSDMPSRNTGRVRTTLTQKRRDMSRSSGFSSSRETVRGSSAMPQIGHVPGWSRTIWGCIGHVHSTRVDCAGGASSRGVVTVSVHFVPLIPRAHLWVPLSRGAVADFDRFEPVALLARMHHDAVALVEVLPVADRLPAAESGFRRDLRLPFVIVGVLHADLIRGD